MGVKIVGYKSIAAAWFLHLLLARSSGSCNTRGACSATIQRHCRRAALLSVTVSSARRGGDISTSPAGRIGTALPGPDARSSTLAGFCWMWVGDLRGQIPALLQRGIALVPGKALEDPRQHARISRALCARRRPITGCWRPESSPPPSSRIMDLRLLPGRNGIRESRARCRATGSRRQCRSPRRPGP